MCHNLLVHRECSGHKIIFLKKNKAVNFTKLTLKDQLYTVNNIVKLHELYFNIIFQVPDVP